MTLAGAEIADPPRYLIGVADLPLADPYDPARLEAKLDAGADVVWTQIAYDVEALAAWAEVMRARGIFERAKVLVGVVPLRTREGRPVHGREAARRAGARRDHPALWRTPGEDAPARRRGAHDRRGGGHRAGSAVVAGVHLMGMGHDDVVRPWSRARACSLARPGAR